MLEEISEPLHGDEVKWVLGLQTDATDTVAFSSSHAGDVDAGCYVLLVLSMSSSCFTYLVVQTEPANLVWEYTSSGCRVFFWSFFCRLVIDHANFVLMFWGNEHATVTGEWESIVCRCFLYFVSTFKSNTTEEKRDLLRVTKHTGRLGVSLTQSRSVLDLFKQVVPVSADLDFLIHTISRPTNAC